MPSIVSEVITEVRSLLDQPVVGSDGADSRHTNAQLRAWINDAERDIARQAKWDHQEGLTVSLAADTQEASLSTSVIELDHASWSATADNLTYPLRYIAHKDILHLAQTQLTYASGKPAWYYKKNSPGSLKIGVFPIPSEAGTITYSGTLAPTEHSTTSSSDSDSLNTPTGWEDLVTEYVTYKAQMSSSDPRWQGTKADYQEHLTTLMDYSLTDFTSQWGHIVPAGSGYGTWPDGMWDWDAW